MRRWRLCVIIYVSIYNSPFRETGSFMRVPKVALTWWPDRMAVPVTGRHYFFGQNSVGPAAAIAGRAWQRPAVRRRLAALPGANACRFATVTGDA